MGKTSADAASGKPGFDLPRDAGSTRKRPAMIPDQRNDENLAVAQTHLAFLRFHNRVVDTLPAGARRRSASSTRARDRRQALPVDDPARLPAADLRAGVVDDVFTNGRKVLRSAPADRRAHDADRVLGRRVPARPQHDPRATTTGTSVFDDSAGSLDLLFASRDERVLGGGTRLPSNWIADFRRLYDFSEAGRATWAPAGEVQPRAAHRHARCRPARGAAAGLLRRPNAEDGTMAANLAFRNLTRAKMVRSRPASRWPPSCEPRA